MTYKFVGVLNTLNKDQTKVLRVMGLGVLLGLAIEIARKVVFKNPKYLAWKDKSGSTRAIDFTLDALIIASPYASSFGGFVDFESSFWWGIGGIVASLIAGRRTPEPVAKDGEVLPEDMSGTSLVGGGLIAGESLFALWLGLSGLISRGALGKIFGG